MRWLSAHAVPALLVSFGCILRPCEGAASLSALSGLRGVRRANAPPSTVGGIVPASVSTRLVDNGEARFSGAFAPLFEMLVLGNAGSDLAGDRSKAETESAQSPLDDIIDKVKDVVGDAKSKAQKVAEGHAKKIARPLMDKINEIRAEMCHRRPNLEEHKPCLKFLGIVCEKASTGKGICAKFGDLAVDRCEQEEDPELKKLVCGIAKKIAHHASTEPPTARPSPAPDRTSESAEDAASGEAPAPAEATEGDNKKATPTEPPSASLGPAPSRTAESADDAASGEAPAPAAAKDVDNKESAPMEEDLPDLDGDGIPDDADDDIDGDGIPNAKDSFPRDAKEWEDSDGDGVGDNADDFPLNPACSDDSHPPCQKPKVVEDAPGFDPTETDKVEKPLPPQGYSEHDTGPPVEHDDAKTYTGDWLKEWPTYPEELDKETIQRICEEHPDNDWCRQYGKE